jgi:hypothetical protein
VAGRGVEIVPTQTVPDEDAAVRGHYDETRTAFPDQRHELIALRHSDDAVIVERVYGDEPTVAAAGTFRG